VRRDGAPVVPCSHTFTGTQDVVTGTYNATVANSATGAQAHTSRQVLPGGGP
jgi:hypothetical protein